MFERYTEGARRTIFFARYEAAQIGSAQIETEHILLGLLREDRALFRRALPGVDYESIHKEVITHTRIEGGKKIALSADLPLSNASKRVLAFGAEEGVRLAHRHIGTEHLLLGLLREEKQPAAQLLRDRGTDLAKLRLEMSKLPTPWLSDGGFPIPTPNLRPEKVETVEIHGARWDLDYVHDVVKRCREYNWHWHKRSWEPRDIVLNIKQGSVSFDLNLAEDLENFRLVEGGWKKDRCLICRWDLFKSEGDPEHGIGYTNGREWLCIECYERFLASPDFFASAYGEIS
jgi:hypothetical protein